MKYAIRYYSKSGNTKKLADAISEVLDVPAYDLSHELTEDVDVLFSVLEYMDVHWILP